jgi:LAO/AO transport system kinase
MNDLSRHPSAYVRPSPSRGALGGLAEATSDVVLLCEGAGYDVVLVETVGLGQSEVAIDSAVDFTLLVLPPGGGDELQGVKKGIVECADAIAVNKCDGSLAAAGRNAAAEYTRALQLMRPKHPYNVWFPPVLRCSAHTGDGVAELWQTALRFREALGRAGVLQSRRREQATLRMWAGFDRGLVQMGRGSGAVQERARGLAAALEAGARTPRAASAVLLEELVKEIAGGRGR